MLQNWYVIFSLLRHLALPFVTDRLYPAFESQRVTVSYTTSIAFGAIVIVDLESLLMLAQSQSRMDSRCRFMNDDNSDCLHVAEMSQYIDQTAE